MLLILSNGTKHCVKREFLLKTKEMNINYNRDEMMNDIQVLIGDDKF